MPDIRFNPWKLATIALSIVILTVALVRLLAVNWAQSEAQPTMTPPAPRSTPAPVCEPSPQQAAEATRPVKGAQRPRSARPRARYVASRPQALTPPAQPRQTSAVTQESTGPSGEPVQNAVVDGSERASKDAVSDVSTPVLAKTPPRFDWKAAFKHDRKALSRPDEFKAKAALTESP
jgi:cytoskeletal protein RodZ